MFQNTNKLFIRLIIVLSFMTTNLNAQELKTVTSVDLKKYSGTWYEIASFPQRFQKGCEFTTADYTPTDNGFVMVENRCKRNGKQSSVKGKAFVEKNSGNAKLKIQFFWPFKGKYWIIDLADDYSYAVVSHPNRKYLWILSRKPKLEEEVYNGIIQRLEKNGFDLKKLKLTKQL